MTLLFARPESAGILARQAAFYAILCAGTGASLPFLPSWLGHYGMSPTEIGWILAIPLLCRAVTGPLSGLWADRFIKYRTPLLGLALAAAAAYGLMALTPFTGLKSFYIFAGLFGLGFTAVASVTPLLDAMTMQLGRSERFSFSWVRAVGSGAFIFASICLGYMLRNVGVDIVLCWMVASACLMVVGAKFLLPPNARVDPSLWVRRDQPSLVRLRALWDSKAFVLLILALGCLQAAHSYYYAFSTIIWQGDGLSATSCGYLWALAVAAELMFLSFGGRLRRRLGPWRLLLLGAVAGALRWGLAAIVSDFWLLWPLQLLHSLSFVAVYLAGLELVYILVPPGHEGLGQAINSSYASGAMTGVGMLFSGMIFENYGARGYGFMSLLAGFGLCIVAWLYFAKQPLFATGRSGVHKSGS